MSVVAKSTLMNKKVSIPKKAEDTRIMALGFEVPFCSVDKVSSCVFWRPSKKIRPKTREQKLAASAFLGINQNYN